MSSLENSGLSENEKKSLGESYADIIVPLDLEKKTIGELRRRGQFSNAFAFNSYSRIASALGLAIAIFFAGFFSAKKFNDSAPATTNKYLMLLYNPENFIKSNSHASEYGIWFRSMEEKGIMKAGEELKNEGWMITSGGSKNVTNENQSDSISAKGYFILEAKTDADALAIASNCPHLKYNGRIELRPIRKNN